MISVIAPAAESFTSSSSRVLCLAPDTPRPLYVRVARSPAWRTRSMDAGAAQLEAAGIEERVVFEDPAAVYAEAGGAETAARFGGAGRGQLDFGFSRLGSPSW